MEAKERIEEMKLELRDIHEYEPIMDYHNYIAKTVSDHINKVIEELISEQL